MRAPPPMSPEDALPYIVTPGLRQRLDLLHHLLEFGRQMIVIQGAPGCGRSRLLQAATAEANPNWVVLSCHGGGIAGVEDLAGLVAEGLQLDAAGIDDVETLANLVGGRLVDLDDDRRVAVLAIDDADDLDDDCCALLFRLAHTADERGALRVLLCSSNESDFIERLQDSAPHPALVHVVDVPPLAGPQVAQLAQNLLGSYDLDDNALADLDIEKLTRAFNGNPGRIVASLRQRAQSAPPPRPASPTIGVRAYAVVAASFVLVASVVGILLLAQRQTSVEPSVVEITLPARSAPAVTGERRGPNSDPTTDHRALGADVEIPPPAPPAGQPQAVGADSASAASGTAPGLAKFPAAAAPPTPLEESPPASPPRAQPDAGPAATPDTAAEAERTIVDQATPAADAGTKAVEREPAVVKREAPAPASAVAEIDGGDAAKAAYSAAWLLEQEPQTYVIQLFGVRDRAAAARFIREQGLADRTAIMQMSLEHRPWYVVVLGHYPDRGAASAAIRKLPAVLARYQPWPRPVGSLRNE